MLHIMVCSIASLLICIASLLEINCTIGFVLHQCFSILFEFQVIRKGCIFSPFFAICSFISSPPAAIVHLFSNYIVALRDDQ